MKYKFERLPTIPENHELNLTQEHNVVISQSSMCVLYSEIGDMKFSDLEKMKLRSSFMLTVLASQEAMKASLNNFRGHEKNIKLWFGSADNETIKYIKASVNSIHQVLGDPMKILKFVDTRTSEEQHARYERFEDIPEDQGEPVDTGINYQRLYCLNNSSYYKTVHPTSFGYQRLLNNKKNNKIQNPELFFRYAKKIPSVNQVHIDPMTGQKNLIIPDFGYHIRVSPTMLSPVTPDSERVPIIYHLLAHRVLGTMNPYFDTPRVDQFDPNLWSRLRCYNIARNNPKMSLQQSANWGFFAWSFIQIDKEFIDECSELFATT
ncbi:MAG: hypothetical protein KAH18_04710 [Psychromonas sp.]|nr:hypothetical protein [Psychromonas sp.]